MANWFRRKKRQHNVEELSKVEIKSIDYPAKIILAWSKAIEGNDDIMLWLKDNGYPELVMATYAIYLKDDARTWLQENGYPHLMAMINAAEGNESAQQWLMTHNFQLLYHIAQVVEDEKESFEWLLRNAPADIVLLTKSIKKIKDQIEENHNDIHTFRQDI
jgi:ribosomal protein S15P/S13E